MVKRNLISSIVALILLAGLGLTAIAQTMYKPPNQEELEKLSREELMNHIRREKFDLILPQVMREHKIDMWIQVHRASNPEFIRDDMGSHNGVFIFTDRGGDRIERAVFGQKVSDLVWECGAYDILPEKVSLREKPGSQETELDRRFIGLGEFVAERDPKHIAVNYLESLGLPIGNQSPNQSDGISYTDYNLLTKELGDKYAERIVSAEYLIFDYLSRGVPSEFVMMKQIRQMCMDKLEKEFDKIVPGVTKRSDLSVSARPLNRDRSSVRYRGRGYIFQRGDLIMLDYGREGYVYRPEWEYGNFYETETIYAYLLHEDETELPPELKF